MNSIHFNKFSLPVVTGKPQTNSQRQEETTAQTSDGGLSFQELLKNRMAESNSSLAFSKHAMNRVIERNIDVSDESLGRLEEGVKIAEEKGLNETLILVDRTAFIVNIKNNMVITTTNSDELKGNVFTNIDGTVII